MGQVVQVPASRYSVALHITHADGDGVVSCVVVGAVTTAANTLEGSDVVSKEKNANNIISPSNKPSNMYPR